jgi:hypothetical protein
MYKHLSGKVILKNVPGISKEIALAFLTEANVMENKLLKPSEVEEEFQFTNKQSSKAPGLAHLNSYQRLVRFEFLEFLVRICGAKYRNKKICSSFSDSIQMMMRDGFDKILRTFDFTKW